jgi:CRP-like cAMP-binding protein
MDRDEGLQVLASRGWLAAAGPAFAATLLPLARWRRYAPGEVLTLGGDERGDLVGLAQGMVAFTSVLGRPETPVMHMAPAVMWMGYGPALRGGQRVNTAEARSVAWAASFPRARVQALLETGALDWRPFVGLIAEYGDVCALMAADLLIRESGARCAAVLARFAGLRTPVTGAMPVAMVPVTQGELAGACNLSRGVTGEILRRMAEAGAVGTGYGGIAIHDAGALLRLAAGAAGQV